ncbi:MAG TPA: pirin family protein [Thermoplasmata archaeon]|nr:pirin family protein [Thermoplasmata archaeon]
MATPDETRDLKIVRGEIDASDRTTSLLFPNRDQGPWLPFERFAETMTTARTKVERHNHQAEEVFMYVLDGEIQHIDGSGRHDALTPGSTAVLTAHEQMSHELVAVPGKRARWLSIVVRLPWHTEPPPTSLQVKGPSEAKEAADGSVQRPVIGPLARADAFSGLELVDLEFAKTGTGFFRIGRNRRGVAYVLNGSGKINNVEVDPGSGVLLENISGVAIGGSPGYRVALATVPVPAEPKPEGPEPVRRRVK